MAGWVGLLEVSVVGVRALPLLAGRVLHALAHQVVAHVADALQRVREVRADLRERGDCRMIMIYSFCNSIKLQGDHSACSKPPIDIDLKVVF